MPYSVGDTVVLDGIESVIIYDAGSDQSWGRYIVVDKNHDLCYYINGDDYLGATTSFSEWAVEWGKYGVGADQSTGITSQAIGDGLSNTNSLLSLNLKPYNPDSGDMMWDWVRTFRSSYTDKWFVPTSNELLEVYNQKSYLNNLNTSGSYYFYWTSSEYQSGNAYTVYFNNGGCFTTSKNLHFNRVRLCRYTTDEELNSPKIGDTYTLDGVESVIIYDAGSEQDWGRFILADKNHDLCYYIDGEDYVNESEYETFPGTFGYEWGGYETSTDITSQAIGDGLSNTNSLLTLDLQPDTSGWRVLWSMVEQFRSTHSDDWFVPTVQELQQAYNQRSYLENLSTSTNPYYWTSSENSNLSVRGVLFSSGNINIYKNLHASRARLCRYASYALLTGKTIGMSCPTPSSTIYYTTDNSTPSNASNLYSNNFLIGTGTTIKAIGTREGWIDSDIATLTVEE